MNKTRSLLIIFAILVSGYSIVQYFIMDAHQAGFVQLDLRQIFGHKKVNFLLSSFPH